MRNVGIYILLLLGCLGIQSAVLAQVPANCPNVCDQKYALCIAASCDPRRTGKCGECDKSDGSCGYCYVFDGKSCSYNLTCDQLKPSGKTVYSTYSERLSADFGFKVLTCPSSTFAADCMDGKCTLTGKRVTLTNNKGEKVQVPTAICECKFISGQGGGMTLGGQCNTANCSATWSVAGGVLENLPHCQ